MTRKGACSHHPVTPSERPRGHPGARPEPGHELSRGRVDGPNTSSGGSWFGPSQQVYSRCTCGWVQVAVVAASLALYERAHLEAARGATRPAR